MVINMYKSLYKYVCIHFFHLYEQIVSLGRLYRPV